MLSRTILCNRCIRQICRPSTFAQSFPRCNHLPVITRIQIRDYHKGPKTPDLIYIPHIFRWLKTKIQLKYLQKTWDPEFSEGAFIYGTTKAVCRITEIINDNRPEELEDLMTLSARQKLRQVMKTRLTKTQKTIIKLNPEDIKILVPINVRFKSNSSTSKDCTIAMRVLALKWIRPKPGPMRLVLVALQTEFQRDYQMGRNSQWTISGFDILECIILSTTPTYK